MLPMFDVRTLDDANQAASALSDGISDLENEEGELSDSSKVTEKKIEVLEKELDVAQKNAIAHSFKNAARAIEDLKHGTISAASAFGDYNAEVDKAIKANEEYQKASNEDGCWYEGDSGRDRHAGTVPWQY